MTAVQACDGPKAWAISPFRGRKEPQNLTADDAKGLIEQSDISGPLVDYRAKGHAIEYLGTEDIDGTEAHKLRVTLKNGDAQVIYFDPDAFLEIRVVNRRMIRGQEEVQTVELGEYEKVDGIYFPFEVGRSQIGDDRAEPGDRSESLRYSGGRPMKALVISAGLLAAAGAAAADGARFDAGVVSGLGARNIGSAAMSGRIAAARYAVRKDGEDDDLRRRGQRRRLEVDRRRHDVQAGVRQAAGAVDRRDHDRSEEPQDDLGRHRRVVDAQLGLDRRRHLQVRPTAARPGRTWGFAESERIVKILVDPDNGDTRLRLRARQAVERLRRSRRLQDDRRRQDLDAGAQGREPLDRLLDDPMDPKEPDDAVRRHVGLPPQGLDVPLRRRDADRGLGQRPVPLDRRRRDVDRAHRGRQQGLPDEAVGPHRGRGRAVRRRTSSTRSSSRPPRALYRSDDGGKTWEQARHEPEDGLAAVLLRAPHRRSEEPEPPVQAGPRPDRQSPTAARASPTSAAARTATVHDLWIDPDEHASTSSAATTAASGTPTTAATRWWKANNLPISQFYHVSVDNDDPYHVYGGLQDNSSWVGDSPYPGGITNSRWENMYGGDGFWMFADPTDPDYIYAECAGRLRSAASTASTHESRDIQPAASYKEKLRFNWNTPIHLSPEREGHDLHRLAVPVPLARPRPDAGSASRRTCPTNDPEQAEAGGVGRRHRRQLRRRDAHDDLLDQRVAEERPA